MQQTLRAKSSMQRPNTADYQSAARDEHVGVELGLSAGVDTDGPTSNFRDIQDNTCGNRCLYMSKRSRCLQLILLISLVSLCVVGASLWITANPSVGAADVQAPSDDTLDDDGQPDCVEAPEDYELPAENLFLVTTQYVQQAAMCGPDQVDELLVLATEKFPFNVALWKMQLPDASEAAIASALVAYHTAYMDWVAAAMPCTCAPGEESTPGKCGQSPATVATLMARTKDTMDAFYNMITRALHETESPPDLIDQWACHQKLIDSAAYGKAHPKDKTAFHVFNQYSAVCADAFYNVGTDINDLRFMP